jgi:hypothetical protein
MVLILIKPYSTIAGMDWAAVIGLGVPLRLEVS